MAGLVESGQVVLEKKIFFISSMYFRNFVIISTLEKGGALHSNKLESSSPKDALRQIRLKLVQWFLSGRFLNVVNVFLVFHNYLPLEKDRALHLNKRESPSPKDALSQVSLKLVQWFL